MHMGHMYISIIMDIATAFMDVFSLLLGLKLLYSLCCILSKGNCIFGEMNRRVLPL